MCASITLFNTVPLYLSLFDNFLIWTFEFKFFFMQLIKIQNKNKNSMNK